MPQAVCYAVSLPFRLGTSCFFENKLQKTTPPIVCGHLLATEQHRRALPVTTHAGPPVLHAQSARALEQEALANMEGQSPSRAIPFHHRPGQTFPTRRRTTACRPPTCRTWLSRLAHTEQMATEQQARALYAPSLSTRHATPAAGLVLTELARAP